MTARGKAVATEENQVLWEFSESDPGAFTKMKYQVNLLHTKTARGNLQHPVFQKIQGLLKLKVGNGHIISTYPLKSCLAWTKSIRL